MTSFLIVANNNNQVLINANLIWNVASNTYYYEANNALYADKDGNPLRPPSDFNANTFISSEKPIVTFYTQHYDLGNSAAAESISIEKTTTLTQNSVIVSYNNTHINALGTFITNSDLTITSNSFIINTSSNSVITINTNSISANSNNSNSTTKFEVGFVAGSSKFQVVNTYSNSTINSVTSFVGNTSGLVVSNTFANATQSILAQFFGNTAGVLVVNTSTNSTVNVVSQFYGNTNGILVSSNTTNSTANAIYTLTTNAGSISVSNTTQNSSVNAVATFLANTNYLIVSNSFANSTHTVNTFYSANSSYFGLALSDANTTYTTNTNLSANVSSLVFKTIEPQYLSTGATANTRTRNLVINVSSISGNISIANTANTVNTVFAVPFVTPPVTITADYTIGDYDYWIINNKPAATCTLTFPAASAWPARIINIKTIQNRTVVSATANIIPLNGGAADTAILQGTVGKWATLVSDGTNWVIMQSN
jgi:hypothetical protein